MTTVAAPTRHKVPQAARDLREQFRSNTWGGGIDSWFSAGLDFATVIAIAGDVRVTATWCVRWGCDVYEFSGATVRTRGAGHPAADWARLAPLYMTESPGAVSIEMGVVWDAARLDGDAAGEWARTLIGANR